MTLADAKSGGPIKKFGTNFTTSAENLFPQFDWSDFYIRALERRELEKRRGKRTLIHEEPLTRDQKHAIRRARALLKALDEEYARPDTLLEHDYDEGYYLPDDIHGKRTYRYENGEEETV